MAQSMTPKSHEGLSLKESIYMNKGLLMKPGWGLVKKKGGLWAKVLRYNMAAMIISSPILK